MAFVQRHPAVLTELMTFSITSALGQYFIFMCVSEFGPLPCSIATTTRKFFTVLASVFFFGNSLVQRQWLGAVLVFAGECQVAIETSQEIDETVVIIQCISFLLGLFLDGLYGKQQAPKAKSKD